MDISYVYHLIDPRNNLPFYVGRGQKKRAYNHITNQKDNSNARKTKTICDIRECGMQPLVRILKSNLSNKEALLLEISEIKKYGRKGFEEGGILTNLTLGGDGGDTSHCFTDETRRKLSEAGRGVKNSRSKLNEAQVIEIFRSSKSASELRQLYKVTNDSIYGIKHYIYYADITKPLNELPGTPQGSHNKFLANETIREIFHFTGTPKQIMLKFGVSVTVVRNIQSRQTYELITKDLTNPGEVIVHRLTPSQKREIRLSKERTKLLCEKFGISDFTVRAIRGKIGR